MPKKEIFDNTKEILPPTPLLKIINSGALSAKFEPISVNSPDGDDYYEIIFIKSGMGYFKIDGKILPISMQNLVVYEPNKEKAYTFYPRDKTEAYFITFKGELAKELMEKFALSPITYFPFGNIFTQIVNILNEEITKSHYHFETLCVSKLLELLVTISRSSEAKLEDKKNSAITNVVLDIENNFFNNTSNEEYAEKCNMCLSYFLKTFKDVTGTTPQQYKMTQRLKFTENLLLTTNYSISEISALAGYEDSLYFSRVFKKANGLSPKQYRNAKQKTNN
jgi:AraC-like DNA-binding protein